MSNALLRFEAFSASFGNFKAVNNLNLSVAHQSFTAIVGESGSGKTVSALSVAKLMGLNVCYEGAIYWKDENLLSLDEARMQKIRGRQIAYVFQDPGSSLNPVLSIAEHFREICSIERAKEALRKARLQDGERVLRSYPHELSGGMKQRVMIALALVSGAELLILDEPTTALDAETEYELMKLLTELRQSEKLTLLFITHNLALARHYSEALYVLEKGRLVETLYPQKNFTPQEAYTRRLFSANFENVVPKTFLELL